ncbi:GNAT family N-acetyltransferase [Marivirga atlantica]|jgi:GNAT superfamily N-acetyltransferase|uniref:GNAT family N-acetyltransferase n=1 Tax=Marivirga atlantica TaxID=1548457 RepID=A0A937AJ89_9BACT|nr:GNAT family N-acetyltransferase [Marivirga atlantica]MBL0766524.1 GNAT family N-acetyltransferase [Marivirga atlantica]
MNFRIAQEEDLTTLNTISVAAKAYWGYPEAWMQHWHDELTLTTENLINEHVLVLEVDDTIIGFSSLIENNDNYEILHLWLLPTHIGKGFGGKLLEATIEHCVNSNKEIIVEADPHAEAFYQHHGFTTFDKVESFPKGRFLPLMRRKKTAKP